MRDLQYALSRRATGLSRVLFIDGLTRRGARRIPFVPFVHILREIGFRSLTSETVMLPCHVRGPFSATSFQFVCQNDKE